MTPDQFKLFVKDFYHPKAKQFMQVKLPPMRYLTVDGKGNPDQQDFPSISKWLYGVVNASKPVAKKLMGKSFGYPPLEFQFWAKNPDDFIQGNNAKWQWRIMLVCADFMPTEVIEEAISKTENKLGSAPGKAKLTTIKEGTAVQYLHTGSAKGIAKVCDKLYGEFLPKNKLTPSGRYHEIYLGDPAKTTAKNQKIIIRQPVKA